MSLALSSKGIILATILLAGAFFAVRLLPTAQEQRKLPDIHLEKLPMNLGGWIGKDADPLGIRAIDTLKFDSHLRRVYVNDQNQTIFLYIAYWKTQTGDYQAAKHSPLICLPANGWITHDAHLHNPASLGGLTVNALVGQSQAQSVLFNYWFRSRTKNYTQEWLAILMAAKDKILSGRNDGALIEVSSILPNSSTLSAKHIKASQQNIDAFLAVLHPELEKIWKGNAT